MAEATYPLSRTKFKVEVDKMPDLKGWLRVTGIRWGTRTSPVYKTHSEQPVHMPGKREAGPIRIERAFDGNDLLSKWAAKHATEPKNGSIIFLDITGSEARRFNWTNGWVSSYSLDEFDAQDSSEGMAREIIEVTVEDVFPG